MTFTNVDELGQLLVRMQLVEPAQLDECLARLEPSHRGPADLLRALETNHYLTTYQVKRLARGESDALVLGPYKLLYRNASGSFARVFRACSITDGSTIGVKILRRRWAREPKVVAEFRREAELCKKLRHKNIVPIYEVASQGDIHYFTMEFVEGGNLRDFIKIRRKVAPAEATRYARDMAEGLDYALAQGITHRDLKPTNVLMSSRGVAKLVDFGLAGDVELSGASSDDVRRALEYAALERGSNAPRDDPRSDLYFLGAIYYEMLAGEPPYPRTHKRDERMRFSRYANVRRIRDVDPNVPRVVADIVDRLLQVNPDVRYQTPSSLIADLNYALEELGESGERGGMAQPLPMKESPAAEKTLPTVMCIESRGKQQDILRDYLSKRGFRVLVLSDVARGLDRLRQSPPDCVILMGESIGERVIRAYQDAARQSSETGLVTLAVLSEKQTEWAKNMVQGERARVLIQPIPMRDLRREIDRAMGGQRQALPQSPSEPNDTSSDTVMD